MIRQHFLNINAIINILEKKSRTIDKFKYIINKKAKFLPLLL